MKQRTLFAVFFFKMNTKFFYFSPRRVQLALQLHGPAEGGGGGVGHLYPGQHPGGRDGEVQVGQHLRGGGPGNEDD